MFFHSFNPDGSMNWQGEVLDNPTPDTVRVQLYSWLTGFRTDLKTVTLAETRGWQFYKTESTWIVHAERARR